MWEPDTLRAGSAGSGRSEDGMSGKKMKGPARAVPRAYGRLTRHERDTVQRMLERGASCREIATELGKSPSTVSAEVASHSPAHAAIHARANAVPIAASHTARVAEVCSDTSRRLAPRSLARRAARVGAPVPQASPAAAQDPARIEPHGGARPILLHAPAVRKRSVSAAAGASVLLSPSAPLRARSGSCSAGDEKNDKNNHPCTSISAFAHSSENMLITSRRFAQSVAPCSKASHAEKNVPRAQC